MVLMLARQSLMIKCNMQVSVMTGNYELYYAVGFFCHETGISAPDRNLQPQELFEYILPKVKNFESDDKRLSYLAHMIAEYRVEEGYDEQMKELLEWGLEEKYPWDRDRNIR